MNKGITLIEILLVISLVIIIGGAATPFLSRFILSTNFDAAADNLVGSIRKAQAYSMDGKDGAVWGICLLENSIRIYSGSCSAANTRDSVSIPRTINVSNFSPVTFNVRGEPSYSPTITISSSIKSSTIEINTAGGLIVN